METPNHFSPTNNERRSLVENMVLSASGWRAVFGGNDLSLSTTIAPGYRDIVIAAATVYADTLIRRMPHPTIVIGTDTRPTGPAIADTALRTFLLRGLTVEWIGVSAAPEIMSYVKRTNHCNGFFYVSASHNPQGHNGLKMGFEDGAVVPASTAIPMIEAFRTLITDDAKVEALAKGIAGVSISDVERVIGRRDTVKKDAMSAYRRFSLHVGSGVPIGQEASDAGINEFVARVRDALLARPIGIVGELNGSARSTTIDHALFPELGIRAAIHNDIPGVFSHQILPEGNGLSEASKLLERYHTGDPAFQIAYVPDNDGDRGNIVFVDTSGKAVPLEAQEVFALVVMIELAWARYRGVEAERLAVVANGPTSTRIDRICEHFGAQLFRAEVGEANVVRLGDQLREEGWIVAILGEGSNGGNITPPATVRDPLSTIIALIKLHAFSLGSLWNETIGDEASFIEIVQTLPIFHTIETDDPRAKMRVGRVAHRDLKSAYESLLPHRLTPIIQRLEAYYTAPVDYRVINYEQTETKEGVGNRSGNEQGGLRLVFCDASGIDRASVWMRGSGTEPVFRVLADCEGEDQGLLDYLIEWQREMVESAVAKATAG